VAPAHRFPVDVLILIVRDGRILLTERAGDSYLTGHWAIPGGKVDDGETVTQAALREVAEEVGLTLSPAALQFIGVTHHRPPHSDSRVGFGFIVEIDDTAEPRNLEPDKCTDLAWHDPSHLPDLTMPYTTEIVRLYLEKEPFSEHGWT
jgi:8-oxo-dGTP diphosphatase